MPGRQRPHVRFRARLADADPRARPAGRPAPVHSSGTGPCAVLCQLRGLVRNHDAVAVVAAADASATRDAASDAAGQVQSAQASELHRRRPRNPRQPQAPAAGPAHRTQRGAHRRRVQETEQSAAAEAEKKRATAGKAEQGRQK
ncbi:hypothetical protein KL928_002918 [Ogataea angusta]|uniref:Uncharacterized protein n=1 Tax=Pichia angusta TaxID=870730 RepID=A0AAN6DFX2_PICAN|nr:uncharacterized protein KL928_002918 [Ogataea angusta]KAG7819050.1 hypothetical protein KL928_002918 [Ogataea angusta]